MKMPNLFDALINDFGNFLGNHALTIFIVIGVIILLYIIFKSTEPDLLRRRKEAAREMIRAGKITDYALFNRCYDQFSNYRGKDIEAEKLLIQMDQLKAMELSDKPQIKTQKTTSRYRWCPSCQIEITDKTDKCPICGAALELK
jgi:hypothetical protein